MIAKVFHHLSDALAAYADGLLQLHEFFERDQGDSEEADAIRDQMDMAWHEMSMSEQALAKVLAADLNRLTQQTAQDCESGAVPRLELAINAADWASVLESLPACGTSIGPEIAAFLRGIAWHELGQGLVAIRFFREAHRLVPANPNITTCLIASLLREELVHDAAAIAQSVVTAGTSNAPLYLKSVEAISLDLLEHQDTAPLNHESLAKHAQAAITLATQEQDDSLIPQISGAHVDLALAWDALGKRDNAKQACRDALALHSLNRDAYLLLGWLSTVEDDPNSPPSSQLYELLKERATESPVSFPSSNTNWILKN